MAAARPKSLAEAKDAHQKAYKNHQAALEVLWAAIESKTYGAAMLAWKECHNAVLGLKEATNQLYAHLPELKPKKADKLKPGGKLDNEPTREPTKNPIKEPKKGSALSKKAEKATTNRAAKAGRQSAEKIDEPAADEPTDDGEDKDAP